MLKHFITFLRFACQFFGFCLSNITPIHDENQKYMNTTTTVFGNELHRYSIADGIRDGNVLGFDPYMTATYTDKDLRRAVALEKARLKMKQKRSPMIKNAKCIIST